MSESEMMLPLMAHALSVANLVLLSVAALSCSPFAPQNSKRPCLHELKGRSSLLPLEQSSFRLQLRGGGRNGELGSVRGKRKRERGNAKGDEEEVGLPYQTSTPLIEGHVDVPKERDARSYAAEAARCLAELDPDAALACYEEALKLEPKACWLLDAYGSLLSDLGRVDEALDAFNASYEAELENGSETTSHIRHMYLGQALLGEEGLYHLRIGVNILEEKVRAQTAASNAEHEDDAARTRHQSVGDASQDVMRGEDWIPKLCTARCALAEVILAHDDTGASDAEAEEQLRLAMQLHPDSPDPHQGFVGLRLSQGRREEAGEYMQSVLRILADTTDECMPAIDFRLQSAKLLIELGLATDAIKVLRRVAKERDDIAELWYLLCYAYRLAGKEKKVQESARIGKRHVRSVGGFEQARHPITGEELTAADFEDVVRGVGTTEREVEAMEEEEREQRRRDIEVMRRMGQRRGAQEEEEEGEEDDGEERERSEEETEYEEEEEEASEA